MRHRYPERGVVVGSPISLDDWHRGEIFVEKGRTYNLGESFRIELDAAVFMLDCFRSHILVIVSELPACEF